jgi:uncharacterized membrane protein
MKGAAGTEALDNIWVCISSELLTLNDELLCSFLGFLCCMTLLGNLFSNQDSHVKCGMASLIGMYIHRYLEP